ncbi:hypothetical protein OG349_21450 [Streptomyces sp. NBC_01317]|uniref:hypothetical protein n=1 Tax=Streptomyces sp. NBC_01317 TaxID=2903822 RepID=UPI002E13B644|nr:hypothetical protein OG349_21450 [Streptomyces sp. NBC_01317]
MTLDLYLDKTDDELFELLGAGLLDDGLGISPADRGANRRFGKQWFEHKHRDLQRKICHQERVRGLLGTTGSDRVLDAAAVYEVLQHLGEEPATAGVLAVLVARIGLGSFCANAPAPS